jgi:phage tail-like protein
LAAAGGDAYYDFADGWLPLVAQARPRYVEEATFYTPLRDGREIDCVWHRLLLDATIPHEAEVAIWSRAANSMDELAASPWLPEPHLYRRGDGSEQPYAFRLARAGGDSWELLFQRAQGRFLQLRVTLRGNGRMTPRLYAMRLYYPRFSYLKEYLPALYRDDTESASFLDRFLANVEGFYTAIEDKIAAVQLLFDARSAPPETLDWLASWYCIALDPTWDEARRRLFLRHAMDFFQWRGTRRGLLMALRLTLDECPDESIFTDAPPRIQRGGTVRIIEKYRTRLLSNLALGDSTESSGLRVVAPGVKWQPSQGGDALRRLYGAFLSGDPNHFAPFPLQMPANAGEAAQWSAFIQQQLGFTPVVSGDVENAAWRGFLRRRYQLIDALNLAYGAGQALGSFEEASLPTQLPADGAALRDWFDFHTLVLPMRAMAHQFSVLLPAPTGQSNVPQNDPQRLQLAKRIVDLEKPAHTVFDVKFYWAMFRVGAALLGEDSLLDRGSRAPELMPPFVLGQEYLAEAFLAASHPQNVAARQVVGSMVLDK